MTINEEIILLPDFLDFKVYPLTEFDKSQFKGKNLQKTLLFLGKNSQSEKQIQFLEKIISAIKFDLLEDTLIYNINQDQPVGFNTICQNYEIEKVIFFDVTPQSLGLHLQIPKYQPTNWSNFKLLYADSLSKISIDQRLKGNLWNALKAMFL